MPLTRFLETKFHIPAWRPTGVSRPRLVELLQAGLLDERRLALISAPAGYGKSTLIAEWIHTLSGSPTRTAWLSLDESDNAPPRFLSYLLSAFARIDPALDHKKHGLLEMPQFSSSATVLDDLLNDLSNLETQILLVLDDYHLITHPDIHEAVAYFIENQPAQIHLVIATRADPPLPIARLRSRGQMTEIRAHQLRFTLDETRQFFDRSLQTEIKQEWIDTLEARTEGWAAGLQLAALALLNLPDQQDFIQTFRGSHRYILDYLAEEVIRQQGDDIYRFLMQTSVLNRFNTALCNAVTERDDSHLVLAHLEQANLFLIPLDHDREWYRYHRLFGDYLLTGLTKDEQTRMQMKASVWHEANEMPFEAVHYALASGNTEFAADVIERVTQDSSIWSGGSIATLASWLDALPLQVLQNRPVLSLNASRVLYLTGRIDLSETLLDQAAGNLDELPASAREGWLAVAASYHGAAAAVRGEIHRSIQLTNSALDRLPSNDLLIRARAAFTLAIAYTSLGDTHQAIHTYFQSSLLAQSAGVIYLAINARCEAALLQIQQGDLQQTVQTCQEAINLCDDGYIPPVGIALAILGEIARERNDLSTASRQIAEGIELSRRGGLTEDLRTELLFQSRVYTAMGNFNGASAAVNQAVSIMQFYGTPRVTNLANAIRARMRLAAGDIHSAAVWAHSYASLQTQSVEYLREFEDVTLGHILHAMHQQDQALQILDPLIEQAQAGGRNRVVIEGLLLQASIHQTLQNTGTAAASLEKALALAAPSGFYRLIIDSGTLVTQLLPQVRAVAPYFVDELLHMLKNISAGTNIDPASETHVEDLVKPLSQQERRVLLLIVAGKSNGEIAAELVISTGTAKWHVHNILQKLGVNNRPQAIARARELGID